MSDKDHRDGHFETKQQNYCAQQICFVDICLGSFRLPQQTFSFVSIDWKQFRQSQSKQHRIPGTFLHARHQATAVKIHAEVAMGQESPVRVCCFVCKWKGYCSCIHLLRLPQSSFNHEISHSVFSSPSGCVGRTPITEYGEYVAIRGLRERCSSQTQTEAGDPGRLISSGRCPGPW